MIMHDDVAPSPARRLLPEGSTHAVTARRAVAIGALSMAAAAVLVTAATISAMAQGLPIRPGMWQMTMERTVDGRPAPPLQNEECLTAQDLQEYADVKQFALAMTLTGDADECKVTDVNVTGSKVTFTAQCDDGGTRSRSAVEVDMTADAFRAVTRTEAGAMAVTSTLTGKRTGSCGR
jgi:hypothetical protein